MTTAEHLAEKFQAVLGEQYRFFVNAAFNAEFTTPIQSPYGRVNDIKTESFKKYENIVVSVVSTTQNNLYATPYKLINEIYTVQFWVPTNFMNRNRYGTPIEAPSFDFYGDIERISENIRNMPIYFYEGDKRYRAFLTMSEPSFVTLERSDAFDRAIFQITGQISLADAEVGTGGDVQISLVIDDEEAFFENITNIQVISNDDSNAVQDTATIENEQEVAVRSHQVAFEVDDVMNSAAMQLIERKAFQSPEFLTAADTLERSRKVHVRLYKNGELKKDFWAVISVQYTATGAAGFGRYSVQLFDDGGDENA